MRISELSRSSGVSVPTIKYYLREGLLPPGRFTATNQADYDNDHLRRLRLVRALISVRGLSVNATAAIMQSLPQDGKSVHFTLGLVLGALDVGQQGRKPVSNRNLHAIKNLVDTLGWQVHEESTAPETLASTLDSLHDLGLDVDARSLLPYARLAEQLADIDLDQLGQTDDNLALAERAVLLTVLLEPALLALRRMAQEHRSAVRNSAQVPAADPAIP